MWRAEIRKTKLLQFVILFTKIYNQDNSHEQLSFEVHTHIHIIKTYKISPPNSSKTMRKFSREHTSMVLTYNLGYCQVSGTPKQLNNCEQNISHLNNVI